MKHSSPSPIGDDGRSNGVMDIHDALRRLGNDEELLRDIARIYLDDAPAMLERIHAAVAASDSNLLQRAAHSLKGLAANLSARDVVGVAFRLEHMGETKNLAEAVEAITEIDYRVSQLNQAIQRYLGEK